MWKNKGDNSTRCGTLSTSSWLNGLRLMVGTKSKKKKKKIGSKLKKRYITNSVLKIEMTRLVRSV